MRKLPEIDPDQPESTSLHQQIRCFERLADVGFRGTDPEESFQIDPDVVCGCWIKNTSRVDKSANLFFISDLG